MKRLYLFAVVLLLYWECKAQAQQSLNHVETLNKPAVIIKGSSLSDSLYTFTSSIYSSITPYIENNNQDVYFKQFSFCVKINDRGSIDTVLISDNADWKLRQHISKIQNRLNYTDLIKQVKAKKWHDVNIIFPFIVLYEEHKKEKGFKGLIDFGHQELQKAFSFTNTSVTNAIIIEPRVLVFSTVY